MVANITTGKDVYGALAYNQEKVDRGDGKVLLTHIVREPADGRFNVAATAEDLLRWMPCNLQIFLCLFLEKLNMPQNTPVTKAS